MRRHATRAGGPGRCSSWEAAQRASCRTTWCPPANRTTRDFLPRLYSKPDMVKEIWKYLHKPLYVNVGQLDGHGRTAAQVATAHGKDDVAALLQSLSL